MLTMPDFAVLPSPVYFRSGTLAPAQWEPHAHPWGQFNFVAHGVMELTLQGRRLVSPPLYAIWIPPGVEHASAHRAALDYRSVYLDASRCEAMPGAACALTVSPLLRALLEEFAALGVAMPATPAHERMAAVVLDQIRQMTPADNFLPTTEHPVLRAAMADCEANLSRADSLDVIAQAQHMSRRTFERLALAQLGINFGEWRQRLRFMRAAEALLLGQTIDRVAAEVGYANASSFGEMFKRRSGQTPDQFRRRAGGV